MAAGSKRNQAAVGRENGRALRVIGSSVRKVDGLSKCAGVTKFADDIVLPRMAFARLLRSP